MSIVKRIEQMLVRLPYAAAALYVALVVVFVTITAGTLLDLADRREAAAAARAILDQLESHSPATPSVASAGDVSVPAGPPFLEGSTASVAGASLLQRVTAAATRVRGNIQSSQVDLQGPQPKPGFVSVTTNLELDATAVQPLLYDLEAGMPILFVDQLILQAASGPGSGRPGADAKPGDKVRVTLSVSGQWRGAK